MQNLSKRVGVASLARTCFAKHAEPGIIRFCSNQKISEKAKTELEQEIRRVCTSADVHVEGIQQIAAALVGHPEPLGRWYMGEIESLRQALVYSVGDEKACVEGMRIALTTQLTNNALQLREDTTRNLALTALCSAGENSLDGLARSVSEALHLRRPVHADYLRTTLDGLCHEGLVEKRETSYAISSVKGASATAFPFRLQTTPTAIGRHHCWNGVMPRRRLLPASRSSSAIPANCSIAA